MAGLREQARRLKTQTHALYLVAQDPRTPWYAKLLAAAVVAYALSPIDLIPDFIPVLGYLDDLVVIPLGIWLAIRLVPEDVMSESRDRAAAESGELPVSRAAAAVVLLVWLLLATLAVVLVWHVARRA